MSTPNIAKHIADARKRLNLTQEQLAGALHVSPQAVSKWETGTCQPDTQTLPQIADFFHVSIDYLFYGQDMAYDEIYDKVGQKIGAYPQMSKESYEDALRLFARAHNGIALGGRGHSLSDQASHISNENGLSLVCKRGYGAIVTRKFFEYVTPHTVNYALPLLTALSDRDSLLAVMAIVSMSDISWHELQEKLNTISEQALREALDKLIAANIVIVEESKHKALGKTYTINSMMHTCLCVLLATLEMQRHTMEGINCCMGYGDYPISLE